MKILTIGRKGADIVIDDDTISRRHAELTLSDNGKLYLVDCASSNGTEVQREGRWESIKQEFVREDDEVRFAGQYTMTVRELLKRNGV